MGDRIGIVSLVKDPWRIFLTTDHPNGAPFTTYPHLIRLLMDKSYRNERLATIHRGAAAMSTLGSLDREYTLYEIAIMTRAAPARSLGLTDRGHLGLGAAADITVYKEHKDRERMFSQPQFVFKDGELVVKNGKVIRSLMAVPMWSGRTTIRRIDRILRPHLEKYHTLGWENRKLRDEEIAGEGRGRILIAKCTPRQAA